MFAGTVCALAHGACLPALLLVFGEMTDIFINAADNDARLNETELANLGCDWEQFGYTWEQIAPPDGNFDKLTYVYAPF